jgi:RNA recognition motif-containing protein
MFSAFGPVSGLKLIYKHGRSAGYGFVHMRDDHGLAAIAALNGLQHYGRRMLVLPARERKHYEKAKKENQHVLCRNCCIPMVRNGSAWLCERCGLIWNTARKDHAAPTATILS